MQVCPRCGEQNPDRFRLCGFCGEALAAAPAPHDVRKTVTVVFSDLVGSTMLGERLDTETLREVLSLYFQRMKAEIDRHGGTVEKFIGDAVMAVFGLPRVREDDALRAVAAAWSMKEALQQLNERLERTFGVRLANRTGVNTGEVVAGDAAAGQRLVTGDAVNTAARLEQAAPENEILIGPLTHRLIAHAVEVDAIEPLTLKGKAEPVPAFRLLAVRHGAEGVRRRVDLPMIGRDSEMAALREAFDRAATGRSAEMVAVLAPVGTGKSRLVAEFLAETAEAAQAFRGRCHLYGESGITFWPLAEVMRQAAGLEEGDDRPGALAKLEAIAGRDAADRVAAAIGIGEGAFPLEETFWGIRRALESLARRAPTILVFDDIHWAETTFLDLLEHLLDTVEDAPLLLVCLARPDLLEEHPDWAQGRTNASFLTLEALTDAQGATVIENLLGRAGLDVGVVERIVRSADGNPLFLEQMVSMLLDDGVLVPNEAGVLELAGEQSAFAIPPTIHALLSARLDHLTDEERMVVERASIIGPVFTRSAVEALSDGNARIRVGFNLDSLVRKLLMRPDHSLGVEHGYRFQHALVRDAAYLGLLKRVRAELHERLAVWLEAGKGSRLLRSEEIMGYHFERACGYRRDLAGPDDERVRANAERGSLHLAEAGRRAFDRGDLPGAGGLLERAVKLLPHEDPARLELLPDLGEALLDLGELVQASAYLDEAVEQAEAVGDRRLAAEADLIRAQVHAHLAEEGWTASVIRDAEAAIELLEVMCDHATLAKAWRALSTAYGASGNYGQAEKAVERVIEHARAADDLRQETRVLPSFAMAATYGPMPVATAIERCNALVSRAAGDRKAVALILCALTQLHAMEGDFDRAREANAAARAHLEEIGSKVLAASTSLDAGVAELLAGRPEEAAKVLLSDYAALEAVGERSLRSTMAGLLGVALYDLGRDEEAERFSRVSEDEATSEDRESQALWRRVRAKVLARSGAVEESRTLAREAVAVTGETDSPVLQADALADLAEVLSLTMAPEEATATFQEALVLYRRKGNISATHRTQESLRRLLASTASA